jgi:hypothetical protein
MLKNQKSKFLPVLPVHPRIVMLKFLSLGLISVALGLCGCNEHGSKSFHKALICVGNIPSGDEASAAALLASFTNNGFGCAFEGSVVWSIYVQRKDAEKARRLLRTNASFTVTAVNNGILQLRPLRREAGTVNRATTETTSAREPQAEKPGVK